MAAAVGRAKIAKDKLTESEHQSEEPKKDIPLDDPSEAEAVCT